MHELLLDCSVVQHHPEDSSLVEIDDSVLVEALTAYTEKTSLLAET